MVFTWVCKNIIKGLKGILGLPLGHQRCKSIIIPISTKDMTSVMVWKNIP